MIVLAIHLSLNGAFLSVDLKENMFRKFIVCVVCLFKSKPNSFVQFSFRFELMLSYSFQIISIIIIYIIIIINIITKTTRKFSQFIHKRHCE